MSWRHTRKWLFAVALLGLGGALLLVKPPGSAEEPVKTLPETDRQFLWDAENRGLELGKFGWPQLSEALRTAEAAAIAAVCSGEFRAEVPSLPKRVEADREFAHVIRLEADDDNWTNLSAEQFADWLLTHRELFETAPRIGFSLKAITPERREAPNGDWRGTVELSMRGDQSSGGPSEVVVRFDFHCVRPDREAMADGAWLHACRVQQINVAKAGRPLLREASAEKGLPTHLHDNWPGGDKLVHTGGVYACDYNRDGRLDVLVIDTPQHVPLMLYRGGPEGRFTNVTKEAGLASVPYAERAAFVDIDRDGWEDLVLPGLAVFRNIDGRYFENMSDLTNLLHLTALQGPAENITGIVAADYDLDGRVDLYVTRADAMHFKQGSWIDGKSGMRWQNQLLRNQGSGRFEDVTDATGTGGEHRSVFTAAWLDANSDGRPDLYLIHEFGAGVLLINDADGTFKKHELSEQSSDFGSMGLACGDINNDGRIDLYVSNMYSKAGNRVIDNLPPGFYSDEIIYKLRRMVAGSQLYVNRGDLRFDAIGKKVQVSNIGWGWGPALVDLDNDGWLDLYSTCGFTSHDRNKPDG